MSTVENYPGCVGGPPYTRRAMDAAHRKGGTRHGTRIGCCATGTPGLFFVGGLAVLWLIALLSHELTRPVPDRLPRTLSFLKIPPSDGPCQLFIAKWCIRRALRILRGCLFQIWRQCSLGNSPEGEQVAGDVDQEVGRGGCRSDLAFWGAGKEAATGRHPSGRRRVPPAPSGGRPESKSGGSVLGHGKVGSRGPVGMPATTDPAKSRHVSDRTFSGSPS
jgi:hypothetical protein